MKKETTKILSIIIITFFVIPQVTFAAWWNPVSWFAGNQTNHPAVVVSSSTSVFSAEKESTKTSMSFSWWNPISWFKRGGANIQRQNNEITKNEEATSTDELSEMEKLKKEIEILKQGNNQTTETEKIKKEIENLKNKPIVAPVTSFSVPQNQSNASVVEKPKQSVAINYDKELNEFIAETRQRIGTFTQAANQADDFVPVVKSTMNKYPDDSAIQQSGQALVNENNNFASISRKLVAIENSRANKFSSYLGLNTLPPADQFSQITADYNNYYAQYTASDAKINSLMPTFVANEKSFLERKDAQLKQDISAIKNELSQQISARQKQLSDLADKIEVQQNRYDSACSPSGEVTQSFCNGTRARIAANDLNPLINQYNALLGGFSGKLSPVNQTSFRFETNPNGLGGRLYDTNGTASYTFDCDQFGNCSIFGQ